MPGYETSAWFGVVAPRATPSPLIEQLHKEINTILADPAMKARLADLGAEPFASTTAEFVNFLANEVEKWAKVIRAVKIKPE